MSNKEIRILTSDMYTYVAKIDWGMGPQPFPFNNKISNGNRDKSKQQISNQQNCLIHRPAASH